MGVCSSVDASNLAVVKENFNAEGAAVTAVRSLKNGSRDGKTASFTVTIDRIKCAGLTAADLTSSDAYVVFAFKKKSDDDDPILRRTTIHRSSLCPVFPDKIVFLFELLTKELKDAIVSVEVWDNNEFRSDVFLGNRAGRNAGRVAFNAKIELVSTFNVMFSTVRVAIGSVGGQQDAATANARRNPKCILQYRLGTGLINEGNSDSFISSKKRQRPIVGLGTSRMLRWSGETLAPISHFGAFSDLRTSTIRVRVVHEELSAKATAKRAASKWLKLRKKNAPTRLAKQEAEHKGAMLHVQDKQTASAQRGYSSDNVSSDSNDDDDEDDDDNDKDGDNDDFKDHALEIPQRKSSQKKLHVPQRLSSAQRIANELSHFVVHGECWLSVGKILDLSKPIKNGDESLFTQHLSSFEEMLFLDGKAIGRIQGDVVFERVPIVEQLTGGVLTELGIQASSNAVVSSQRSGMLNSHGMPQQILRLSKLQLEFEAAFYDETANRSDSETTKRIGENIMNILRESNRQSMLAYQYSNRTHLLKAQKSLLSLCMFLKRNLVAYQKFHLRVLFFEMIFHVLKRSELANIYQLGFDPLNEDGGFIHRSLTVSERNDALQFALEYRDFLMSLRSQVLSMMKMKMNKVKEPTRFCARMLAILYFRLPFFGDDLNFVILPPGDVDVSIEEWRGTYFQIDKLTEGGAFDVPAQDADVSDVEKDTAQNGTSAEAEAASAKKQIKSLSRRRIRRRGSLTRIGEQRSQRTLSEGNIDDLQNTDPTLLVFNWEPLHSALKGFNPKEVERQDYRHGLKNEDWGARLAKRRNLFFEFSEAFLTEILDVVGVLPQAQTIEWHSIPGYVAVLKCVILQMKKKRPEQYPASLLRVTRSFLANTDIMDNFLLILFSKTNAHSTLSVSIALEIAMSWLETMPNWGSRVALFQFPLKQLVRIKLKPSFDSSVLLRVTDTLLMDGMMSQVSLKMLEFLYGAWDFFPEVEADRFRNMIAMDYLYPLMLNWNKETRTFFVHLLVFRILRPTRWWVGEGEREGGGSLSFTQRHASALASPQRSGVGSAICISPNSEASPSFVSNPPSFLLIARCFAAIREIRRSYMKYMEDRAAKFGASAIEAFETVNPEDVEVIVEEDEKKVPKIQVTRKMLELSEEKKASLWRREEEDKQLLAEAVGWKGLSAPSREQTRYAGPALRLFDDLQTMAKKMEEDVKQGVTVNLPQLEWITVVRDESEGRMVLALIGQGDDED